jgi:hypothetical protein
VRLPADPVRDADLRGELSSNMASQRSVPSGAAADVGKAMLAEQQSLNRENRGRWDSMDFSGDGDSRRRALTSATERTG